MNVFELRNRLISEYAEFTRSFLTIRDQRIADLVNKELDAGLLWPQPMVQMNPAFEMAETVDELVEAGLLHEGCRQIFRLKSTGDPTGRPLRLYRHQADAIRVAATGQSYVLTTGTGSGKSLAYLIPIVDRVLREGPGRGVRAIVIYPMNALANSQAGELEKFLNLGFPDGRGPVRFKRYTGQETEEDRRRIVEDPPDIILTNYMMLELILTRPFERDLIRAARDLRFLVLDELHTYRGRQGSDVAMLVRRVREACEAAHLQCVGTSATLAGAGTIDEQRREVARVATLLFGTEVSTEAIILETLRRATDDCDPSDPGSLAELRTRLEQTRDDPDAATPTTYEAFVRDPLARWLESALGVSRDGGRLVRARPRPLEGQEGLARELSELTGCPEDLCARAIRNTLLAGYRLQQPDTGFPVFAFRLHQFFSRGEAVYASLEPGDRRYVTTNGQQYVPGDRSRILVPLAFCRECGQEYYTVRLTGEEGARVAEAREFFDVQGDSTRIGYLYRSEEEPWPDDPTQALERLPDSWVSADGEVFRQYRPHLPQKLRLAPDGRESPDGTEFWFVGAPLKFCLTCGVTYVTRERKDAGKLTTLGVGGRTSATTILVAEAIRALRADRDLPSHARKILSFTDNRQDASLQAGHFNDFIEIGLLRAALYRAALKAGSDGLHHDELTQRVFEALDLPFELYARDPNVRFAAREETNRALRDVLGYRLYRDLERGWRVTAPNLEQCGLLEIAYVSLDELCRDDNVWKSLHPVLAGASPEDRYSAAKALLDQLRWGLAIRVDYLSAGFQERLRQRSHQHLVPPWAIDEDERLERASVAYPRSRRPKDYGGDLFLSARSRFGRFLRRPTTFREWKTPLGLGDAQKMIADLLCALREAGLVTVVDETGDVPGYQLSAAGMRWRAGDGTRPVHDPTRVASVPHEGLRVNEYFVKLYRTVAGEATGLEAREHTAQVAAEERERREDLFRKGKLPVLFCSPTMELGVDIAELNVVNLRNVPPTPANYAQRSGRAGRRGRPALVFTYCAAGNSHDQYFFRRPHQMVAGRVRPPQLDLTNEDLVRAHVHAVWLAETGADLGSSLRDVLELEGEQPSLQLRESLRAALANPRARERAADRCRRILGTIPDLERAEWYDPGWLDRCLTRALDEFEQASERWRTLYRAALKTREEQNRIVGDASRSPQERERAKRLREEAEAQLELLRAETNGDRPYQSDFYSYRYFASEGFLPGYNFPRLPLSAFIPGRRGAAGRDEFLSRPRFLAISEFGPRSIVYHEGSRYRINRVILPPDRTEEGRLVTLSAKQCDRCGYLHPIRESPGPDLCERCGHDLGIPIEHLFRLQNVSTRRIDRINSDEEERQRQGYEIRTGVRFAEGEHGPRARSAQAVVNGIEVARLTYSGAATLWRINLGWRRRAKPEVVGFLLDTERGYWVRNEQDPEDQDDPLSPRLERVVPYVEDRRNALLFEPCQPQDTRTMASLAAALKRGVLITFQLEEQELAVEPLPTESRRHLLLLYEAAEGGAGVLRRLVEEKDALARVARAALEACHFNPDTGEDRRRPPGAKEDCEAACYDCLMSYTNQLDHPLLDRKAVRDLLLDLARATVVASAGPEPRSEHLQRLLRLCQTELERRWLRFIEDRRLELPSRAQVYIQEAQARPDFVYDGARAAVFVDGPAHVYADVRLRDGRATERLEDLGYTVVRFPYDADWEEVVRKWPSLFGRPA